MNPNVNIGRVGDSVVAMTETPLAVAFDPETLETVGVVGWHDDLDGQLTTAHPHQDPKTGDLVNYLLKFDRESQYQIYRLSAGCLQRRLIGRIPVSRPGYMHSFAITEHHVVLVEFPLTVNPLRLLLAGRPFIDNYRWHGDRPTRFLVMNSDDGKLRGVYETDAFFSFHHINAFEDGEALVVDLCAYDDATVVDALRLDALRNEETTVPPGYPTRYRLDMNTGSIESRRLADVAMELPRVAYSRVNGRPYRYAYGIGSDDSAGGFATSLVKLDAATGETHVWKEEHCFPGEPVFVAEPGATGEDQGVILSIVLDARTGASRLVVLDAQSLKETARAEVPHAIPFGFHGSFTRRS
jgi:carotenoid cleavage dioxygenase-like enzyme